jgi:PhoH-like ATPase
MIHSLAQLDFSVTDSDRKYYILDTSVLLSDPKALFKFEENVVLIPLIVITELEKKRNDPELGYFAREALRNIEDLQGDDFANSEVNDIPGTDGKFSIITSTNLDILPDGIDIRSNDALILATALECSRIVSGVVLVSRDLPMRILASSLGIKSETYRASAIAKSEWSGIETVEVEYSDFKKLMDSNSMNIPDSELPVNTGVIVKCGTSSALAIYVGNGNFVNITDMDEVFEVKARSAEQKIALSHLLRESTGIVSIGGAAGTGKSAMALLAGIEGVLEHKKYKKVIVFRPLYAVGGQDLGYLPGDHDEKMNPWSQAVYDTLEPLVSENVINELQDRGAIEVLPLTHIRGRSLHDAYVIVDEAQSLERNVLLTVLSRMGQNSKIVLTHDVAQRDNLHVGRWDGILSVVEALKGNELFAHVTLRKSERSRIAELVTKLLDF